MQTFYFYSPFEVLSSQPSPAIEESKGGKGRDSELGEGRGTLTEPSQSGERLGRATESERPHHRRVEARLAGCLFDPFFSLCCCSCSFSLYSFPRVFYPFSIYCFELGRSHWAPPHYRRQAKRRGWSWLSFPEAGGTLHINLRGDQ